MSAFRIVKRQDDVFWIFHGARKVAILLPAKPEKLWLGISLVPATPWVIVPDPEAFPDPACVGLPRPLSPAGNRFDSYAQAEAFLGIAAPEGLEAAA